MQCFLYLFTLRYLLAGKDSVAWELLIPTNPQSFFVYKSIIQFQIHSNLSQPRWPSYKLYGMPQSKFLEACPTNLHTSVMGVGVNSDFAPQSPSRGSISERSMSETDEDGLDINYSRTSYCISTATIPTVEGENICVSFGEGRGGWVWEVVGGEKYLVHGT